MPGHGIQTTCSLPPGSVFRVPLKKALAATLKTFTAKV